MRKTLIQLLFWTTLILYIIEIFSGMDAVVTLLVMIGMALTEVGIESQQRDHDA